MLGPYSFLGAWGYLFFVSEGMHHGVFGGLRCSHLSYSPSYG